MKRDEVHKQIRTRTRHQIRGGARSSSQRDSLIKNLILNTLFLFQKNKSFQNWRIWGEANWTSWSTLDWGHSEKSIFLHAPVLSKNSVDTENQGLSGIQETRDWKQQPWFHFWLNHRFEDSQPGLRKETWNEKQIFARSGRSTNVVDVWTGNQGLRAFFSI